MAMPSYHHDGLLQVLRKQPRLVPELLARIGVTVPPYTEMTIADSTLERLAPTEVCADLVLELGDGGTAPRLAIVVEVQLRPDDDKLYSLPVYQTTLRMRRRCDVCVVVVTPYRNVAAWARRPICLGPGNEAFRVLVIGPEQFSPIADPTAAAANPGLALLTVLALGEAAGPLAVLTEVVRRIPQVDRDNVPVYLHLLNKALGAATCRAIAEWAMQESSELELPEVFQSLIDRGVAEGKAQGKAEILLQILGFRGIHLSAPQRARILACNDEVQFAVWAQQAILAKTADELFG